MLSQIFKYHYHCNCPDFGLIFPLCKRMSSFSADTSQEFRGLTTDSQMVWLKLTNRQGEGVAKPTWQTLWEQEGIRNSLFQLFLQLICGSELFLNKESGRGGRWESAYHLTHPPPVLCENFYKEGRTSSSGSRGDVGQEFFPRGFSFLKSL